MEILFPSRLRFFILPTLQQKSTERDSYDQRRLQRRCLTSSKHQRTDCGGKTSEREVKEGWKICHQWQPHHAHDTTRMSCFPLLLAVSVILIIIVAASSSRKCKYCRQNAEWDATREWRAKGSCIFAALSFIFGIRDAYN